MLTTLLERGSWVIYKIGMPLVFFYHLIIGSIFLNTSAEDAKGIEKAANVALIPFQYFFEGKTAVPYLDEQGKKAYYFKRRFSYEKRFYVRTAASAALLPFSISVGGALKGLSYLSASVKERAKQIYLSAHSAVVSSNLSYYTLIGMDMRSLETAEEIAPPKHKKPPLVKHSAKHRLYEDTLALKEVARILNKHQIPFWVDCGTCLGAYRHGGAIPHDWDVDIGALISDFHNIKNALQELDPKKYVVQDWSGRDRPYSYLKVFVHASGGMIDIYHFAIDAEKQMLHTVLSNEDNIFVPESWIIREKRYGTPMPFSYVFPLKKALFEGIEVPVPGQVEKYLMTFYGENLEPAHIYNEITGLYEKDLTHPYWQIPYAH